MIYIQLIGSQPVKMMAVLGREDASHVHILRWPDRLRNA